MVSKCGGIGKAWKLRNRETETLGNGETGKLRNGDIGTLGHAKTGKYGLLSGIKRKPKG